MSAIDTSLFTPELVFFDFEASDRLDFFKRMSETLAEKGYVEETWYDAIVKREESWPTGLNCEAVSVAIPHVDPEHIKRAYIAIVRPSQPIAFEGMGGIGGEVNAQLIFNLGLRRHAEDQVAVLQALMNIFMDTASVEKIMSQTTPEGMVETVTQLCLEA